VPGEVNALELTEGLDSKRFCDFTCGMFAAQDGVPAPLAIALRLGSSTSRSFRERVLVTPAKGFGNRHRAQLRFLRRPHGCGRRACVLITKRTPAHMEPLLGYGTLQKSMGAYPQENSCGAALIAGRLASFENSERSEFLAYVSGFRRSGSNSSPFNNSLPARLLSLSVFLWTSANSSCRMNCNSRVGAVLALRQSARRRSSRRRCGTNISTAIEVGAR